MKVVGTIVLTIVSIVLAGVFTTGDRHIGRLTAANFLTEYYSTAIANPSVAWNRQYPDYQAISGSYTSFENFISAYQRIEIDRVDVDPDRNGYFIARVRYTPKGGGGTKVERRAYLLRCTARVWFSVLRSNEECAVSDVLIADSRIV